MISTLHGKVTLTGHDWVILDVNGIGFRVSLPASRLEASFTPGDSITLYTHLHVREDILALYGFPTTEELRLFEMLITVSGIGPKLGLAFLSAMEADTLVSAIATGNSDLLTQIPGVGKKTANRLVLELKDKISIGWATTPQVSRMAQDSSDVVTALVSLGYSVSEAARAIASLPADTGLSLEEKIRLALQYFGHR
jgi:holliday junction DNA helicase RuvA